MWNYETETLLKTFEVAGIGFAVLIYWMANNEIVVLPFEACVAIYYFAFLNFKPRQHVLCEFDLP